MEYLDVVDETGEPVGERVERAEAHARGTVLRTYGSYGVAAVR